MPKTGRTVPSGCEPVGGGSITVDVVFGVRLCIGRGRIR
jgi:hypothetical protein